MKTLLAIASVALALLISGCGHTDGNRAAVRTVARDYVDAFARRDAAEVCSLMAPGQQQLLIDQGAGNCEAGVQRTFRSSDVSRTPGPISIDDLAETPTATIDFAGFGDVQLIKLASTWHVSASPRIGGAP